MRGGVWHFAHSFSCAVWLGLGLYDLLASLSAECLSVEDRNIPLALQNLLGWMGWVRASITFGDGAAFFRWSLIPLSCFNSPTRTVMHFASLFCFCPLLTSTVMRTYQTALNRNKRRWFVCSWIYSALVACFIVVSFVVPWYALWNDWRGGCDRSAGHILVWCDLVGSGAVQCIALCCGVHSNLQFTFVRCCFAAVRWFVMVVSCSYQGHESNIGRA